MSDPVSASGSAPRFGGLTGYKRPAPGAPTSVPSNLPAFRGTINTPGDPIRAPPIVTSKNTGWRKSNCTIPYARVMPHDELRHAGRLSPGDVVFCSRFTCGPMGREVARTTRLVGVDYLNRELGGKPNSKHEKTYQNNWEVGRTVLLGPPTDTSYDDWIDPKKPAFLASTIADNWRELTFLCEWALDGVVLSNDEPGVLLTRTHR